MKWFALLVVYLWSESCLSQDLKTENIIIVALDGYRWQEVFRGADARISKSKKFVRDPDSISEFTETENKRQALMPFFWEVVVKEGQLYGNRDFGNKVNCSNLQLISYPGYNEMLTGFADHRIHSNRKVANPNTTVLEFLNKQKQFQGKVAAFSTWDAFPYILNEKRSGIHVNAGAELALGNISTEERWLNENQAIVINPSNGTRYDEFTYQYAKEFMKREKPKVLFLSFNETDEFGHAGRYDEYLKAAYKADQLIADLWEYIQTSPAYKDRTTLIITTDHGRGRGKNNWTRHRLFARGSRQIWLAVIGPDTPALGEVKKRNKYYQKQLAKTISAFAGEQYHSATSNSEVMQSMIKRDDAGALVTRER
ncbi:MAG TPA: alkaline phosphatase family protein [Chryseosolibacter sp.]